MCVYSIKLQTLYIRKEKKLCNGVNVETENSGTDTATTLYKALGVASY